MSYSRLDADLPSLLTCSQSSLADDEGEKRLPPSVEDPRTPSPPSSRSRLDLMTTTSRDQPPPLLFSPSMPVSEALKAMVNSGARTAWIRWSAATVFADQDVSRIQLADLVNLFNSFPSAPISYCQDQRHPSGAAAHLDSRS